VFLCSALGLVFAPALRGDDHHACSYRSVAGKWGYSFTGTTAESHTPMAGAGIFTLDRSGNVLDGTMSFIINQEIHHFTLSGPYSVNPDCTGSMSLDILEDGSPIELGFPFDLVWIENSNALRMLSLDAELVLVIDAKKLFTNGD
jgi:hypothetical protein